LWPGTSAAASMSTKCAPGSLFALGPACRVPVQSAMRGNAPIRNAATIKSKCRIQEPSYLALTHIPAWADGRNSHNSGCVDGSALSNKVLTRHRTRHFARGDQLGCGFADALMQGIEEMRWLRGSSRRGFRPRS